MRTRRRQRVVVLGGGYAGLVAAARAARAADAEVTLVDAREAFQQRIRFHEILAGRTPATMAYAPALARRGVRFVRAAVASLEVAGGTVAGVRDGKAWAMDFDALVLALGSRTAAQAEGVAAHALRLDDPEAIRRAAADLARLPAGAHVSVVGGGATGVEAAAELAERHPHLRVRLVTGRGFGATLSPEARAELMAALEALRVEVREDDEVAAVAPRALELRGGGTLPSAATVWAAGFQAPALARHAGLSVTADGRVRTDAFLRAEGHPRVWVAGDAAAVRQGDALLRMGCATAMPIGAHAGENVRAALEGREMEPFRFGYVLRCLSLGRRRGLVQVVDADDAPAPRHLSGRRAALVKELICRSTLWGVGAEVRWGVRMTAWKQPDRAPSPEAEAVAAA